MALRAQYISSEEARRQLEEAGRDAPFSTQSEWELHATLREFSWRFGLPEEELRDMLREGIGASGTTSQAREYLTGQLGPAGAAYARAPAGHTPETEWEWRERQRGWRSQSWQERQMREDRALDITAARTAAQYSSSLSPATLARLEAEALSPSRWEQTGPTGGSPGDAPTVPTLHGAPFPARRDPSEGAANRSIAEERMAEVYGDYMRYGHTRPELREMLREGLGPTGTASTAREFLQGHMQDLYGPMPETVDPATGRQRYSPMQWRYMQEHRRARERAGVPWDPARGDMPRAGEWEQAAEATGLAAPWTRQGSTTFYPGDIFERSGFWLTGKEGGVSFPWDPSKTAKRGQLAGAREGMDVYQWTREGLRETSQFAAMRGGEADVVPERGTILNAAIPLANVTEAGMGMLGQDVVQRVAQRKYESVQLPKDFEPTGMAQIGQTWRAGEDIRLFEGATPLPMLRRGAWEEARLMDIQRTESGVQAVFERSQAPEAASLYVKTGGMKATTPVGDVASFTGRSDIEAVLPFKDPLGVVWQHMMAKSPQQLQEQLRGAGWTGGMPSTWKEAGPEFIEAFRQSLPVQDVTYSRAVHPEAAEGYRQLAKQYRGTMTPGEGGMLQFQATIPSLVGPTFAAFGRQHPTRKPRLSSREIERLERQEDPRMYERVMRESAGTRRDYQAIINAAAASTGQFEAPAGAITPTEEQWQALGARAQGLAMEAVGAKDIGDVPPDVLRRQAIEAGREMFGEQPIQMGEGQYFAAPERMHRFLASGVLEEQEATGFGWHYGGALLAKGTGKDVEKNVSAALESQARLGFGSEMQRRGTSAYLERAMGGVIHGSPVLGAAEYMRPVADIQRLYGLKPGTEAAARFSRQWAEASRLSVEEAQKRGLPTPGEAISAYPTSGDEPFQMGMRAIHPEVFKERGGVLSKRTPFVLSRLMTEMLHSDYDGDIAQGLALGHLEAVGESFRIAGMELPWATTKAIKALGTRAIKYGAGELATEVGEGPGGVAGLREALDVSQWGTYSTEEVQGQMSAHQRMQQMIGTGYNWAEQVQRAAGTGEGLPAAQALFNQVYQVMQRPRALPRELEHLRGLSSGYNPVTGGYATYDPETGGYTPMGGGMQGGGGMVGLQRFMLSSMMQLVRGGGATGEPAFTPEQAAALTGPAGAQEAMAGLYGQYAAGKIGEAEALPGLRAAMGGPESLMQTPLGTVSAGRAWQKAVSKYEREEDPAKRAEYEAWFEGLDPGLRKQLETQAYKMEQYRLAMSKRAPADETMEQLTARGTERLRAAHASGMGEGFVEPIATAAQEADVERLLGTLTFPTGPAPAPPPRGSMIERTQRRARAPARAAVAAPEDDFEAQYGMTRAEAGLAPTEERWGGEPGASGWTGPAVPTAPAAGGGMGGGGGRPAVAAPAAAQPGAGRDPAATMFSRIFGVSAQQFRTSTELFAKNLDRWTKEVAPAIESTQELSKAQVSQTKMMLQWQRDMQRGLRQAKAGEWPESMAPTVDLATALGPEGAPGHPGLGALEQAQFAMGQTRYEGGGGGGQPPGRGGWFGAEGPLQGADRFTRRIFSGWELMRLRRLWGMTGGAAMGQIPIAAQQEQAATRAAMVGVPMGQFQMGGMNQQLLAYQAQQQAFQGQVGRAAYGAWGWTQQGVTGRGLATAAGIGGPAIGAGLVGGAMAGWLGLSATGVGLPIAAGAALYGTARYAQEAQADPERMALAMAQGPEAGWDYRMAMAQAGVRPERGGWGQPVYPQAQAPAEQAAYGQRLMTGELAGLTGAGRQAAVQAATEQYAPEWMAPTAAMGAAAEWMRYTPGATNMQQIYQDPRFSAMAMRGATPQMFAQTAGQWGMGPGRWQEIMQQQFAVTEPQAMQAEFAAQQWQGLTAFGMDPMEVREMAYERGAPQKVAGGWQVPEAKLQPLDTLGREAFGQWRQAALQEQVLGLKTPMPPEVGEDMAEQWQAQMPLSQARMGLQQRLTGMGMGGLGIADRLGGDLQGMGMLRRFMGGDQSMMNLVGMQNVGMGAQMGGVSYNLAPLTESFTTMMDAMGKVDPQAASAMSDMFQSLRPLMEQSGLGMGTTQMWQGFMGGYQLPTGVDAGLAGQYGGMVETGGLRALQRAQQGRQYEYQDWRFGEQEENLQWRQVQQFGGTFQGFQTRGTFEIQDEMRNLGRLWEEWMQDWREQNRQVQYGQFMENWQVQAQRLPVQFGWQREDLAFRGAQSTLQYAWGQEDVQEKMRYATGRERRQLMKQQERSTITYAMGMGRLETEGARVDVREQWAKEDLERQKRHFLERFRLQDEYQAKYRSHYERRKALEDELAEIRKFNAQFQLSQDKEALGRAKEMEEHTRAIYAAQTAVNHALDNAQAKQKVFVQNLITGMSRANALAKNMLSTLDAANRAVSDARSSYSAYRHGGSSGATEGYE